MASTNVISSVLGRTVDSAAGGTDTGVPCLAVRDDVLSTLTPADGDYTQLRVDAQGALHVTHTGELGAAVTNDGTFMVQVDGTALTHLATVAGAVTSSVVQTNALVTGRGTEGNLFNAQVISVPYTNSAAVDVSASTRANLFFKGSDPTATDGYDVFVGPESALASTAWVLRQSVWPATTDGRAATLTSRQTVVSIDVAGISWIKLQAHSAETVTASCYSS